MCPKMSGVSVRSVVRLRFSVNYDENRNECANDRKRVTNDILAFQSLIYHILMIRKIFWMSEHVPDSELREKA